VANAPTPKYAAWPNDSRPAWPPSRLNAQANSTAISIWIDALTSDGDNASGKTSNAMTAMLSNVI
jgi:hypothetical protein